MILQIQDNPLPLKKRSIFSFSGAFCIILISEVTNKTSALLFFMDKKIYDQLQEFNKAKIGKQDSTYTKNCTGKCFKKKKLYKTGQFANIN